VRIKDWYILIRQMFGYSLYGLGNEQVNQGHKGRNQETKRRSRLE